MIYNVFTPVAALIQPKDRKCQLKGTRQEEHLEIRDDGFTYALRTSVIPLIIEKENA